MLRAADMDVEITRNELRGRTLKVATLQYEPFIKRHDNENHTWYTGLCMDLLDILSDTLNFTYTITEPADQTYGVQLPNGTWAGLTGMLARKEADVALTGLSVTADRAAVSDHTTGFFHDSVALVASLPDITPVGWTFLIRPLHWHLYLLLGCSLAVTTCVFVWVERHYAMIASGNTGERKRTECTVLSASVGRAAEVLAGTLLGRAMPFKALSTSGRILLYSWSLLSLVMIASYTSKLTSNSVLTRQPLPFNSLSELVKRSDYRWAYSEGSMLETIFATSSNKDYQLFYRKMLEFAADDPHIMSTNPTLAKVLENVLEGNFVFVTSVSFYMAMKYADCRVAIAQERLFQDTLAIHLQKASPYTELFDRVLFRLKETGILKHLNRKWFPDNTRCDVKQTTVAWVSLELVQTAFVIAACGLLVALVVLLTERFGALRRRKQ